MADRVTIKRHSQLTGYSEAAIRSKIAGGVWLENEVWFRAKDGRILISQRGYDRWAGVQESDELDAAYRLISAIRASAVGRG